MHNQSYQRIIKGDRLKWSTLIFGEIHSVTGAVERVIGGSSGDPDCLLVKGTATNGMTVIDRLYSNDKSITWL